jgi:uncharacterized NAD(P)/FAD-binding protein YdhS
MVDYVLSLLQAQHRGQIFTISRRGLLPRVHRRVDPIFIEHDAVPFGAEVSYFMKWLRGLIEYHDAQGRDWRAVVDGLRPFTREVWQNWSEPAKRRFLRHARAWWDVHRHRSAPEVDLQIMDAIKTGQLKIIAGKVQRIETDARGATVTYRRRGEVGLEAIHIAKFVQCTGMGVNPRESANPVLQSLLKQGLARPDPIGIGIDVTADCAVINQLGRPSQRLFAVGPLTSGKFWEIVAIPDIRMQCAHVADFIAAASS